MFNKIVTDQKCKSVHRSYALHWLIRTTSSMHAKIKEMDEKFERQASNGVVPMQNPN